jgi:5,10-methylenetetrahydromethanopterin reductase
MSTSLMLSGNGELSSSAIPEISRHAEEKHFDGLWFGETTLRDATVLTTIAACSTKRIQLGTSIVNIFTRTPSQLALLAATLNEFSGGRFTLGLGVSTAAIVESWHGQRFQAPVHRLDETVTLLRNYFSGEKFSWEGTYSSPQSARLRTGPAPRIALAALNDKMIAKACKLADRIILNLYPAQRVKHVVSIVDEACHGAGNKPRPILSVMLYAYVLADHERGLEAGKDLVAFYASAPAYATLFSSTGYDAESRAMMVAWKAKDREGVKRAVTMEMVNALTVVGSIQDLKKRVDEYHKAGIDDIFICPTPFADYEANIREIVENYNSS